MLKWDEVGKYKQGHVLSEISRQLGIERSAVSQKIKRQMPVSLQELPVVLKYISLPPALRRALCAEFDSLKKLINAPALPR